MIVRVLRRRLAFIAALAAIAAGAVTVSPVGADARQPELTIRLTKVASVESPTALATRTGKSDLYVAERVGRIVVIVDGKLRDDPVLDLRDRVVTDRLEQGLLGLAISPDGSNVYVNFTDRNGDTRVEEYTFTDNGLAVDAGRLVLQVHQPQPNHNGGNLAFGPDGMLYIALGDGGGRGDKRQGHARGGNGQSLHTLLGKILRIDPRRSGADAYTIPPDNPFTEAEGRSEIWSYGLRNPWRFSFDRRTGDLWIGDVGQFLREEIDFVPAAQGAGRGTNFGWSVFEGDHRFRPGKPNGQPWPPLLTFSHDDGRCAVVGGYVYRGRRIPSLVGKYLYSDYCDGHIRYVRQRDNKVLEKGSLRIKSTAISSFGEDNDGELYVLSLRDGLYRIEPT